MIKHTLFRGFIVMNLLLITLVNNAQNTPRLLLDEVMEELSVNNDDENEIDWGDVLERLTEQIEQPYNLNTITKVELERFPFLNDQQIENLLAYLYINGAMQTIYELQLVEGMDRKTIEYLLPFVCVQPAPVKSSFPSVNTIFKYGRQEVLTRLDVPFYTRKGYKKTYLGAPFYHSLRYGFHYKDRLYIGVTAEKDAGEPLAALHNKQGYDYYGFHLFLQNIGRIKSIAVGNYRLAFGQGLVISTDYLMGKSTHLSSFSFRSSGIRKYTSTDEYTYFRGAAAAVSITPSLTLSSFYSHRSMDGKVEDGVITSIYKTGLHRSQSEADKKDAFTLQLAGGNLSYQKRQLKVGFTGIYYTFNQPYEPSLNGYARYRLHGKSFYNLGVDYQYRLGQFSLQGEVATGTRGIASLNKFQYTPIQGTHLMLLHRYYAHDYWALFARSFGEGSTVQNENGWYLAAETAPFAHWKLFASLDLFSFPWWKYRVSKSSKGIDVSAQATYTPRSDVSMYLNYRYKRKERDVTATQGEVTLPTHHQRLRYRLNYLVTTSLSLRTTVDCNRFQTEAMQPLYGYQFSQSAAYYLPSLPIQASLQGSYFHTDDYDSRVYIAEKGLLYTFYTPSFSGQGFRFALQLRYDINTHWMLIGKVGQTLYTDGRKEIGSGNDLIQGNKKSDLQLQLRLKF